MRVEVVRSLGPSAADIDRVALDLPEGANVDDALRASGLDSPVLAGFAVYGGQVTPAHLLRDGDRLELLRGLRLDPKQARRRRAEGQRGRGNRL